MYYSRGVKCDTEGDGLQNCVTSSLRISEEMGAQVTAVSAQLVGIAWIILLGAFRQVE